MFEFISYKNESGSLNSEFLTYIRDMFDANIFVETGTYSGATTETASQIFSKVHSAELNEKMFNEAREKFNNIHNVSLHFGSSDKILNIVLSSIKSRPIFWLDAHYCGENTAFGDSMTPIKEELEAIKNNNVSDCVIMIDDIRVFGSLINGKEYIVCDAYPTIQWVKNKLLEINTNFNIFLIGDILLAYDKKVFNIDVSEIIQVCTASRLYNGSNYSDQELYNIEIKIIDIDEKESKIINNIAHDQYNLPLDTTLYQYYLWSAFANIKNNPKDSITKLKNIKNLGANCNNLDRYIELGHLYESL